jgi:anaphase-promoting complex subunit 3
LHWTGRFKSSFTLDSDLLTAIKVLEKTKRRELALVQYNEACELDPRSAKARFAKARVLLVLQRPKEAFLELDMLKNMVPDDAKVHYLLGRVYKALHEKTAALRHFTIAMNLDPKVYRGNSF